MTIIEQLDELRSAYNTLNRELLLKGSITATQSQQLTRITNTLVTLAESVSRAR